MNILSRLIVGSLHAYGAQSPKDWGETEVTPFVDNINEKAFCARYELDSVESLLAANMNKRLWVIAAFHKFKDGNQPNFLCREFYYRLNSGKAQSKWKPA